MNKCIKRLVESLFDDDFDDIVNHNDEVTTIGRMIEIKLPYCESYLSEHSRQCSGRGEHVYSEVDLNTDTVAFDIKGDRNKKDYLVDVDFL